MTSTLPDSGPLTDKRGLTPMPQRNAASSVK